MLCWFAQNYIYIYTYIYPSQPFRRISSSICYSISPTYIHTYNHTDTFLNRIFFILAFANQPVVVKVTFLLFLSKFFSTHSIYSVFSYFILVFFPSYKFKSSWIVDNSIRWWKKNYEQKNGKKSQLLKLLFIKKKIKKK